MLKKLLLAATVLSTGLTFANDTAATAKSGKKHSKVAKVDCKKTPEAAACHKDAATTEAAAPKAEAKVEAPAAATTAAPAAAATPAAETTAAPATK